MRYSKASRSFFLMTETPPPTISTPVEENILVVDDEPAVLSIIALVLRKSGFHVLEANSGIKAWEIFQTRHNQIRVVITDMSMPGMSGMDLIQAIRKCDPDLHIIATTGMTTGNQMKKIQEAGVLHVLSKPCGSREIIALVRGLFAKS